MLVIIILTFMKTIKIGTKLFFSDGREAYITKTFNNLYAVNISKFLWSYEELEKYLIKK